ncbi:MAG: UxaA family hydrolase [Peptococcaceae bacterium]
MEQKGLLLGKDDNVVVVIEDVNANEVCGVIKKDFAITAKNNIPFGHKIALGDLAKGAKIIKYNEVIGIATKDIVKGEHVHTHNLSSIRGRGDLEGEKQ